MTGNRYLAETLKGYGVTTIFWMPAVLKPAFMEMERLGGIKRVLCHSEKSAVYMADGYARASRRPGIVMCQSVGAANLAAGLQDAYLAHAPLIAITGRQTAQLRNRNAYQEIFHWPMYEPVTKYNVHVDDVAQLPIQLRQAFREATTTAPGPVHLEMPGFQCEVVGNAEADLDVVIEERFATYPAFRPEPESGAVDAAADLLARAERPVIVAGGGAVASRAAAEVTKLAEKLSIPVATSLNGKGSIVHGHPLAAGIVGTYALPWGNEIVGEADLVLYVGSQTGDQTTDIWTVPQPGTAVIQIDLDPVEIGRGYPGVVPLLGDARQTLRRIIDAVEPAPESAWATQARERVEKGWNEQDALCGSDAVPIRPERICREISDFLPTDALVVSDTGHAASWTGNYILLRHATQDYIRCAGSLGWGLPAAMGAKCAVPDRPVICFTGDGGFWYHLGELETAVRCGINTVTVINNNRSLSQDKPGVDDAYRDHPQGNPEELWVYQDLDLAAVAQSMGCFARRVEHPEDIRPALDEALASGRTAVVDVASDIDAFAPWTRNPMKGS
ncbi:MAG: acetolactate synthase [Phycisphaeraceae bacterium]|nr:acetolactate synthase [Phycisphaeraceae bacterium]